MIVPIPAAAGPGQRARRSPAPHGWARHGRPQGDCGALGERVDLAQQPRSRWPASPVVAARSPASRTRGPSTPVRRPASPTPRLQRRQVHLAPPAGPKAAGTAPAGQRPAWGAPPACGPICPWHRATSRCPAPVRPRNARVRPGGQGDPPAAGRQFVGQLHAGGGGADRQDAAARQGPGGAVGRGRQLHDPGVEPGRQAGDVPEVTSAGGQASWRAEGAGGPRLRGHALRPRPG
jgi:hypothetical protein